MYIQSQHKFDKQPREIYIVIGVTANLSESCFRTFVDVSVIIVLFKCINLKNICTFIFIFN